MNILKNHKIEHIRVLMLQNQLDAYIIPTSDPHKSEYIPDNWKIIQWLSSFSGSAGTIVITMNFAGLWTDSRYFIQAENQLKNSGFELVKLKIPHTPEYIDWLVDNLNQGSTVGVDGKLISVSEEERMRKSFLQKEIHLCAITDLIQSIWTDRPVSSLKKVFLFETVYCGIPRSEKIDQIKKYLSEKKADAILFSGLDEIAWLLNLRGSDIANNPVFISYLIVTQSKIFLFINPQKIEESLLSELSKESVELINYDDFIPYLKTLSGINSLIIDPDKTNFLVASSFPSSTQVISEISEITKLKAIKNITEIENIKKTMIYDGIALVKFLFWLHLSLDESIITELIAQDKLFEFRKQQPEFVDQSFETILAYKEHGAMAHYSATSETNATLQKKSLLLIDSGGNYLTGTTDITRTICLGNPTEEEKKDYTLVLKGNINLASAIFPVGTKGYQIDAMARIPMWKSGIDYGHGTGHGVGFFLNVHEGPHSISKAPNNTILESGMIITNEPGIYRQNFYGIRIENLLLIKEAFETEFGKFLQFENLSICPLDRSLIATEALNQVEKEWINDYHQMVYEKISPFLENEEKAWLMEQTTPL